MGTAAGDGVGLRRSTGLLVLLVLMACVHPARPAGAGQDEDCITTLSGERICGPPSPPHWQSERETSSRPSSQAASRRRSPHGHVSTADLSRDTEHDAARFLHGMHVVDWGARIFKIPHFLSEEEVDALVELGHEALTAQYKDEWVNRHAYSTVFFSNEQYSRNEVLRRFEVCSADF